MVLPSDTDPDPAVWNALCRYSIVRAHRHNDPERALKLEEKRNHRTDENIGVGIPLNSPR